MYIVAMLSVNKGVVFLLLLKNVENELFSIKGSESSKFKNCFSGLFYVPDDSLFLLDSKTPSFLRIGSVIFEILSFETSLGGGGWGFPYSNYSSICIIPICNLFLN